MGVRFQRATLLATLLLAACGEESEPQDELGEDEEPSQSGKRDAGSKDARADARADARSDQGGNDDDDDDDNDLDGDEDVEVALDAGAKRDASSDAATPAADASSASDAAGDAASTPDAAGARGDAGASDGGAGGACGALTYESFGKAFVASYCISCHGASSRQVKLDTLPAIQAAKAQVKRAAVTSKAMPEGGKQPTDEERAKLGQWLDCGPL